MDRNETPNSINDLLAAMADGELDLREQPGALGELAKDPQAAQRVAYQQQLKQACGRAMDTPQMQCPAELEARLRAMAAGASSGQASSGQGFSAVTSTAANDTSNAATSNATSNAASSAVTSSAAKSSATSSAGYAGPPIIARIGRWAPAAIAAVLLIAAGVLFSQANLSGNGGAGGLVGQAAAFLPVDKIDQFTNRHSDCALNTGLLKEADRFGDATEFDQLPGKLGTYFHTSADGLKLSLDGIGYDYQLTGACALPGTGAVHIVYRHRDEPKRSISIWIKPADQRHDTLKPGEVYSISADDPMHPVIIWRQDDLLYYLVGDSLEDCDKAVKQLRRSA